MRITAATVVAAATTTMATIMRAPPPSSLPPAVFPRAPLEAPLRPRARFVPMIVAPIVIVIETMIARVRANLPPQKERMQSRRRLPPRHRIGIAMRAPADQSEAWSASAVQDHSSRNRHRVRPWRHPSQLQLHVRRMVLATATAAATTATTATAAPTRAKVPTSPRICAAERRICADDPAHAPLLAATTVVEDFPHAPIAAAAAAAAESEATCAKVDPERVQESVESSRVICVCQTSRRTLEISLTWPKHFKLPPSTRLLQRLATSHFASWRANDPLEPHRNSARVTAEVSRDACQIIHAHNNRRRRRRRTTATTQPAAAAAAAAA